MLSSLIIRISSPSPFPPPTSGTVQQTYIDQFYKNMFYDMKYTLYISSLSLAFILSPGWASCPQKAVVYISRFKCCKINNDYCRVGGNGELIVALSQAADSRYVTTQHTGQHTRLFYQESIVGEKWLDFH